MPSKKKQVSKKVMAKASEEQILDEKLDASKEEKKEEPIPSKAEDEARYLNKAQQMKALLDKQEKVSIMIPLGQGEKPGAAREHVQINGYIAEYEGQKGLPKGIYITVPRQVAELINDAYNIPNLAGQSLKIDRDKEAQAALS